jgi:L-malate glycosyltransferase
LNVVVLTQYWKNSPGGGALVYKLGLVNALEQKGINLDLVFREGEDLDNFKSNENKLLFPFDSLFHLLNLKPDVISSHGSWYCLLPGVVYKKIFGARLIHTFHSEPTKPLSFLGKLFFQYLLNQ